MHGVSSEIKQNYCDEFKIRGKNRNTIIVALFIKLMEGGGGKSKTLKYPKS